MSVKLIQSTSIVGGATVLSRISGLVRDVVLANILGDRAAADIFFVAYRIPNFFRRIFGEGAFSAAFIPVFTDYREKRTLEDTHRFVELLGGRFALILAGFCALGVLFAPALVTLLAAGFLSEPEKFDLAVRATRITFPFLFFVSIAALYTAMLNSCGRFAAPAAAPILLNVSIICAALWLVPAMAEAPVALAVGVLAAGVAMAAFQAPFVRREQLPLTPRVRKRGEDDPGIEGARRVFRLTLPAILGVSVAQVNVMVNTVLASFLATGSISWLYYSDRIVEFPLGVFGIALSTVILPDLSRKWARDSKQAFSATIDWACRWTLLVCVPATAAIIVLAAPLVSSIYFHGDFTENGVHKTAAAMVAFSFGLLPIVLVKIFAPGFYAREDTRTPVRIAVISMAVNIVCSMALVYPLKHVGLAYATSIAAVVNAGLLLRGIRAEGVYRALPGWPLFIARVVAASAVMAGFLWWFTGPPEQWLAAAVSERAMKLAVLVVSGALVYFASLLALGIRPRAMLDSEGAPGQ